MVKLKITIFGVLVLAMILDVGCRKDSPSTATNKPQVAATSYSQSGGENVTELRVLQWGDNVVLKESFEKYALAHGVKVKVVMVEPYPEVHNDVFDSVRSEKCDVIISPGEILKIDNAKLAKVLLPIDVRRIRNYNDIAESIRNLPTIQDANTVDGKLYAVTFGYDTQTLLYNTERLSTPPDSYAELWDNEHKNHIATMGWLGGYNVAITLLALGYDPATYYNMDADNIDWDHVRPKVDDLIANSRIIYGNMFLAKPWKFDAGELSQCDILFGWGCIQRLLSQTAGNWKIALPKEGSEFWIDDVFIASHLKDKPEKLAVAYLWIEFLLDAKTQIERYKQDPPIIVAPSNADAMRVLRDEGYDDPRLDEKFSTSPRLFIARQTDQRTRNYYRIIWADALKKAGKIKECGYLEESPSTTAPAK